MVPFIIGGIALAATGYGVKKYLENDDNRDKVIDKLDDAYNWLDKTEQKVSRAGKEINLTVKEYQLLLLLAETPKRIFSKQQISEQVWDINFSTNTNTIEVYINFLRKKIDKGFDTKLIHTRPGFGYYIKSEQ